MENFLVVITVDNYLGVLFNGIAVSLLLLSFALRS